MIKDNVKTVDISGTLGFPNVVLNVEEAKKLNWILTDFLSNKDFPLSPDRYEVVTDIRKLKVGDTVYTYEGWRAYDLIVDIGPVKTHRYPNVDELKEYREARVVSFFVDDLNPKQCGLQVSDCWLSYDGSCNQLAHDDGIHVVKDGKL